MSKASIEHRIRVYSLQKTGNALHLKGKAQTELFELTKKKADLEAALLSYNEAISIEEDSSWICERAKIYSKLGRPQEAVSDMQKVKLLSEAGRGVDILRDYHVQSLMEDLAVLGNIKDTISVLRQTTKMPKAFLDSYDNLVDVVSGVRIKVDEHDDQIKWMMDQLNLLLSQKESYSQEELTRKLQILADKVYEIDQKVDLVLCVTDIKYDNPLVELLTPSLMVLGAKAFDMSKMLSQELISEIVAQNDSDLLLAGLMSIDHSD